MEVKETVAELQARQAKLETKVTELKGKADDASKHALMAAKAELAELEAKIELAKTNDRLVAMEARETERKSKDAKSAVGRMVKSGRIGARDEDLQAHWEKKFGDDPELIELVAGKADGGEPQQQQDFGGAVPANPALQRHTKNGTSVGRELESSSSYELNYSGFDVKGAMAAYWKIVARNAAVPMPTMVGSSDRADLYRQKGMLALEAANFYKRVLKANEAAWEGIPLVELGKLSGAVRSNRGAIQAADVTGQTTDNAGHTLDVAGGGNTLGTLSGTLVLQRTLPVFAWKYPELLNFYTDFSDSPGMYKQTEMTRIVTQVATELYDNETDGSGRPKGWSTSSPAVTTDVPVALTDYIGVPIIFGQESLAATVRKLFDEQSVLAVKAIADYFTGMVTALATSANYNAYAVANGTTVPDAYPTYPKAVADWSMSDVDALDSAFTSIKAPDEDRGILMIPKYYARLRSDPRLQFLYAASASTIAAAGDFVTEARLPKLSGFWPYKAPYFPTTSNRFGFAFQKAAVVLKSRLPQDFVKALGVMFPGSVTTVTDPDTKISVMLVQYVQPTQGYAEWRLEVMLGASVGDKRGGLVLTTQ